MKSTTKLFSTSFLLFLTLTILFYAIQPVKASPDSSRVGISSIYTATLYPYQRKSFYANGRFWVFYSDGTNMVYRTSVDGVSWSSATTVRACDNGYAFSIWFDGIYLHYAYAAVSGSSLYYRRGYPNSNGTITWSTDIEQTVSTTYNGAIVPFVCTDSSGYVWISYVDIYYPYVIKSQYNNGSWGTTPSGFPYQLSTTTSGTWRVSIIPLTNGKMLAIYAMPSSTVRARLWNGSAWGTEKATTSAIKYAYYHSAVAQGDDVHLVFLKSTGYDIKYTKYVYASDTFTSEVTVKAGATSTSAPVLSIDNTNKLYVFWASSPTGNHIYYRISEDSGNTWSDIVDWIDETTEVLTNADKLTCFYKQYGNYTGLVYMTNTTSPYNVKFNFLTLPLIMWHTAESWTGTLTTIQWTLAEIWTGTIAGFVYHLAEVWNLVFPFSYTYYLRLGMTFVALIGLLLAPTLAVLGAKFKKAQVIIGVLILYFLVFVLIHLVTSIPNVE